MAFGSDVKLDILANDKTGRAIASARKNLTGLGTTARSVLAGIGGLGSGLLLGRLVGDTARLNMEFETASREVNTLLGLSAEGFRDLQSEIRGVSSALGTDLIDNTKAAYQAISAGVKREDLGRFLRVANKAAIGGLSDTETAVNTLTGVLNAYKGSGLDASRASDILFTAVKDGKTTFSEMADSMYVVAPIAANAGVSFDELGAAIATVTATTGNTAAAMTQIKGAIVALMKPTEEMEAIFAQLGVASGEALIKQRGFGGAMQDIRRAADQSGVSLTKAFGRIEGFNAMLNVTGESAAKFAESYSHAMDSAGAATAAFNEMNETTARSIDKARSAWQSMVTSLQDTSLITSGIDRWTMGVRKIGGAFDGDVYGQFANTVLDNLNPAMRELVELQDAYFRAQDAGAGGKYLAYLDDLIQAKMEEVRVTRDQADAQENLNEVVADADYSKLIAAERKYNEARRTEEQQLRSLEVEYDQLQKQVEEYYRSGMEGSQDVLDIQTRQVEVETRLLRLKEQQNRELETSRERYEDLLREQKILMNPDSEASILAGEIRAMEQELKGIAQGSAAWFEKQAEIISKSNELLRIRRQDEREASRSQDERLRKEKEYIDAVLHGRSPADQTAAAPRSSSRLMADYSNPDYASPWAGFVPPPAAVPAMVPVGQLATTSPSAPESAPMQNAAEAVRGSMTKAADVFDRVVQVVKEFNSRLEIAEQQIANAR